MRAKLSAVLCGTLALALLSGGAQARDDEFTPTVEFTLSDYKVKANPSITIKVAQETGEEELAHVTLTIPKGFKLPTDDKIPNDTQLGTADITIDVGPRCAGQSPASAPVTFPDRRIFEQDRTDDQADAGVKAVWVIDLRLVPVPGAPVTVIPLEVRGSPKKGWTLDGDIPANPFTCPPFSFQADIAAQAGGVPILTNPPKPGDKFFLATFTSQDSPASVTISQKVTIVP